MKSYEERTKYIIENINIRLKQKKEKQKKIIKTVSFSISFILVFFVGFNVFKKNYQSDDFLYFENETESFTTSDPSENTQNTELVTNVSSSVPNKSGITSEKITEYINSDITNITTVTKPAVNKSDVPLSTTVVKITGSAVKTTFNGATKPISLSVTTNMPVMTGLSTVTSHISVVTTKLPVTKPTTGISAVTSLTSDVSVITQPTVSSTCGTAVSLGTTRPPGGNMLLPVVPGNNNGGGMGPAQRYHTCIFANNIYTSAASKVNSDHIGNYLGSAFMRGDGQNIYCWADVYEIKGVSVSRAIAVIFEDDTVFYRYNK